MSAQKMWFGRLALAMALGVCIFSSGALAQDFKDASEPTKDGFKLDVAASAELRSGNVNITTVSDQVDLRYRKSAHEVTLFTSHAFGKQGGQRFLNAFRGLTQYRYGFDLGKPGLDRVGPALIVQYERDEFRRREHLLQTGLGGFVDLFNSETLRWNITLGAIREFEQFAWLTDPVTLKRVADAGYQLESYRAWIGTDFGWEFWDRFHIGENLIIQVPLDHCPCDTRVYTTSFLRIYGNDYVALQSALTVIYDAGPPRFGAIKSFDAIIRSSLVFSL